MFIYTDLVPVDYRMSMGMQVLNNYCLVLAFKIKGNRPWSGYPCMGLFLRHQCCQEQSFRAGPEPGSLAIQALLDLRGPKF